MTMIRRTCSGLAGALLWAAMLSAQETGTVTGRVVEEASLRPLSGANVLVEGTQRGTLTRADGTFLLAGVPAGTHQLRASLIGYGSQVQTVAVAAGQTVNVEFALQLQAVAMEEIVATGYGTQRREAITGSVSSINAEQANVGVISNANEMIQGRAPGVNIVQNSGEPGAGVQVTIRGGTSISASNEPLYVIDGVPVENTAVEPGGIGLRSGAALSRSPLNLLNPGDIQSITILKDASATAIYGARAANGVVLIQTKQGAAGRVVVEYDGYVSRASQTRFLDLMSGEEYRQFIQQQVSAGNMIPERLTGLGQANTDWQRALIRNAPTHNHNLSFSGGGENTQYRASMNYMNQEGVVLNNGFERIQGRLNGTHATFEDRLRIGLNLTASHIANNYLPWENTGGFEGAVFTNMVNFNPTKPIREPDPATGLDRWFELGGGRQSVANPVAMAEQIEDLARSTRTLGNVTAALDLFAGLTGQVNLGLDRSESTRRTYIPRNSAVGVEWDGRARQVNRDNTALTLQTFMNYDQRLGDHGVDLVGGYEYAEYETGEFASESRSFLTDALGYNNLGGGAVVERPWSWRTDHRLVSFFGRANYNFSDRYFLTGVLRRDGSSRFGEGNKWAVFPAVSAAWRLSEEEFLQGGPFSDLRVRVGYGLQGNPGVDPYASLILLEPTGGSRYVFGEQVYTGVAPTRNPNPNLKWEETSQFNVALDFGVMQNRFTGTLEYYVKNTSDLLLTVPVPQPALVSTRIENIGSMRNSGFESSLDAVVMSTASLSWQTGLIFSAERNEVVDIGGRTIRTGGVSGQGQSGQLSQIIMEGQPLGTFWGPEFVGVDSEGRQLFNQYQVERDAQGHEVSRQLVGTTTTPGGDDFLVIGRATPDFSLSLRNQLNWNNFDLSALIRSEVGRDVFNNTALVYATQSNAKQDKNFLRSALTDPVLSEIGIDEPAIFSSLWIEDGSFVRLQNVTVGYTFGTSPFGVPLQNARIYVSGDNLWLGTSYSGYDPEVHTASGLASRGIDYLNYPRPRMLTVGARVAF
jgi:TonB-dependent starch-binding outer membrane protein SusC